MNEKIEGIVIQNRDYRDHDAILRVLSPTSGKIDFIARGLRKMTSKNAGSTQLFQHSYFYYNEKGDGLQLLKSAESIQNHRHLREELLKQCMAEVMCEIMGKVEIDEEQEMFNLLDVSLTHLEGSKNAYTILSLFMAIILHYQGIDPFVDGCVLCGKEKDITAISIRDGGFICASCFGANHMSLNKDTLKKFRLLMKAGIEHITIVEETCDVNKDDFTLILNFFLEYSGITLTSIKFLKKVESLI